MSININILKLSIQRALLGNVSSMLRAVCVDAQENKILAFFYYDGEISEKDRELYNQVIDDIISDFWEDDQKREIEFFMPIIRMDFPEKMPLKGYWVYYRNEENPRD